MLGIHLRRWLNIILTRALIKNIIMKIFFSEHFLNTQVLNLAIYSGAINLIGTWLRPCLQITICIKRLTERNKEFFVFPWQFPADLKKSAAYEQSISFSHINEQTIFFPHFMERTIFWGQLCEQIIFLRKKSPPPVLNGRAITGTNVGKSTVYTEL